METAAGNEAGAMTGFMGMGFAGNAMGGFNPAQQVAMMQQQQQMQQPAPATNSWTCACGSVNQGNFCPNCGEGKTLKCANCGWEAKDGTRPNFCPNCGNKF